MHIPGAEVPCRDATGAGDAFVSGLLHGIAPEDALRLGKIAGANAATRIGCLTAAMNRPGDACPDEKHDGVSLPE